MKPTRCLLAWVLTAVAFASSVAAADEMEERVRNALAPPATIVEFADDLHLSLKQVDRLRSLGRLYQARVDRLHADASEATERLVAALEQDAIDEALALQELAGLNAIEAEIKRLHLELWIECNAELRPLQRKQAVELANRKAERAP